MCEKKVFLNEKIGQLSVMNIAIFFFDRCLFKFLGEAIRIFPTLTQIIDMAWMFLYMWRQHKKSIITKALQNVMNTHHVNDSPPMTHGENFVTFRVSPFCFRKWLGISMISSSDIFKWKWIKNKIIIRETKMNNNSERFFNSSSIHPRAI